MVKTIIYIFVCLICVSCTATQMVEIDTKTVSLSKGDTEQHFSNIFYDYHLTFLKTGDAVFRNIDKLKIWNGNFYIMDKTGKKCVLVFDGKGNFLRLIGISGKGHGEYASIEDFTIDEETGNVIILSYPSTILVYDTNGKYLFTKKIEEHSLLWNIESYSNGFVCSTNHCTYTEGEHAYLLYFFDKDFKLKAKRIPVLPIQMQMPPIVSCPLYVDNKDRITYFDNYTSSIYLASDNDSISIQSIKYDIENYMPNDVFSKSMSFISQQMDYDYVLDVVRYDKGVVVFHSNKGKLYCFKSSFDEDEAVENKYIDWMPKMLCVNNGVVYSTISPKSFSQYKDLFPNSIAEKVRAQDNDMILSFKIK